MPIVLTDFTNKVWCVEQPNDGRLHVGWVGKTGPRVDDILEFLDIKSEQFIKFVAKKRELEVSEKNANGKSGRKPGPKSHLQPSEDRGANSSGEGQS